MGKGSDKKQRSRRKKTEAEKQATVRKKAAERQKKDQQKYGSVSGFFSVPPDGSAASGSGAEANNVDDAPGGDAAQIMTDAPTTNDDVATLDDAQPEGDEDIVIFAEEIDAGSEEDPMIVANLDIDGDSWDGLLDQSAEAEPEVIEPRKMKRGVHLDYMRAVNDRLKIEAKDKTKAFEKQWLIEHLMSNDGWIRKEYAKTMIKYLKSSERSPSTYKDATVTWKAQNKLYYRDIKVWLPDILLPGGCSPFCPTCKSNSHVSRRAYHSMGI